MLDDPLMEGGPGGDGKISGGGGGGNAWQSFVSALKDAASGLSVDGGEKTGTQNHHFLSNKNKTYAPHTAGGYD